MFPATELTSILLQSLGITYIFIGLSMVLNVRYFVKLYKKFAKEGGLLLLVMSFFVMMLSLGFLLHLGNWQGLEEVVLGVLLLLGFAKAVVFLYLPEKMLAWAKKFADKNMLISSGFAAVVIGIFLLWITL